MNKARWKHMAGLLTALGAAVAPAWIDPSQTWPGRIAVTVVTGLLLAVRPDDLRTYRTLILGGLAFGAVIVAGILGRFSDGTAGFAVAGFVAAVLSQVRVALAARLMPPGGTVVPDDSPTGQAVVLPLVPGSEDETRKLSGKLANRPPGKAS